MNIFSILFAIETLLLFSGIVPLTTLSMAFYAVTLIATLASWSDRKNDLKKSKADEALEELFLSNMHNKRGGR